MYNLFEKIYRESKYHPLLNSNKDIYSYIAKQLYEISNQVSHLTSTVSDTGREELENKLINLRSVINDVKSDFMDLCGGSISLDESLREAKLNMKDVQVKIRVTDGNCLISPAWAYFDDDQWEEIDSGTEWIFTGTAADFADSLDYDGTNEDSRNKNNWMDGFQESYREILRLAASTPAGERFSLYGNMSDAIGCEVLETTGGNKIPLNRKEKDAADFNEANKPKFKVGDVVVNPNDFRKGKQFGRTPSKIIRIVTHGRGSKGYWYEATNQHFARTHGKEAGFIIGDYESENELQLVNN